MSLLHLISGGESAEHAADVVFLHGLGGDAFATWQCGEAKTSSWPHQLGREFPQVRVWSLGYAASPTRWIRLLGLFSERWRNAGHTMALPDRARQVLDLMIQRRMGERPLLFICHSLGGLVAKQILRQSADATDPRKQGVARNTRAVLFLATPHQGATLASLLNAFRVVFGTTVSIGDLRAHDAHLRDLFDWYRNYANRVGIATVTYFESKGVRGVLPIVNPTSAHPGVGEDPIGLDEDHLSIAKPRSPDAQVWGAARALLRTNVLAPSPAPAQVLSPPGPPALDPGTTAEPGWRPTQASPQIVVQVAAPEPMAAGRRIPHELPPPAEEFFGRRTELARLIERIRLGKNTAVVGPAGLGKTALAAEAVRAVAGTTPEELARSPFPDGIVFLDLYTFHGQAEPAWNTLANKLEGADYRERASGRERATEACRARRFLLVLEGGEEADGEEGRSSLEELFSVLSPQNRWLLLTRLSTQAAPVESIDVKEALHSDDASRLLDALTRGHLPAAVRERVLGLLEGHPLALTWAGNLLAREEDDPGRLVRDWEAGRLPPLSDPRQAEHTLEWLFRRSVRGLDYAAQQILTAAGLLARAPFPLAAAEAALGSSSEEDARAALKTLLRRGLLRWTGEEDHWEFTHVLGYRFARQETGSDPELRERLGQWLSGHLTATLASYYTGDSSRSLTLTLDHVAALLHADDDQRLWMPLAASTLYIAADRLTDLGRLALVNLVISAVAGWLERFPAEKIQEPYWYLHRTVFFYREGDMLRVQGNMHGALAIYQRALATCLAVADNATANRWPEELYDGYMYVSYTGYIKVGDALRDQGDLPGALAVYGEALTLSQQLAAKEPLNTVWQSNLSMSHEKIGDVLSDQGDLVGAVTAHREALELTQQLAATEPWVKEWQRNLSLGHSKIGRALRRQNDFSGALANYQEALSIIQPLAEADPFNTAWQHDLYIDYLGMGETLSTEGTNLSGALTAYQEALVIIQRLTEVEPTNVFWQSHRSSVLRSIAELNERMGNRTAALRFAMESVEISERLVTIAPSEAIWQNGLVSSRALVVRLQS